MVARDHDETSRRSGKALYDTPIVATDLRETNAPACIGATIADRCRTHHPLKHAARGLLKIRSEGRKDILGSRRDRAGNATHFEIGRVRQHTFVASLPEGRERVLEKRQTSRLRLHIRDDAL